MPSQLNGGSLRLAWSLAPWDEAVCGFPVLQITDIEVHGADADSDLQVFEGERDRIGAGLVSCRLPHECMRESMLLEDHGFRFIEMVYRPGLELAKLPVGAGDTGLSVFDASDRDMPRLLEIARTAFRSERFRMDPRLDPDISDQRYQNWVASSRGHASQELQVIRDGERTIAFFVTEMLSDGTCYWHLNAVAPEAQGQGYGRRVWLCMLQQASLLGAQRVQTSIAARNSKVLNLYARLGFQFSPPTMTFHWIRAK